MFLHVNKGQSNELTVTLTELRDATVAENWLFVFVKEAGATEYRVFLTDTSTHQERYNQFTLIEGTDVTFKEAGEYQYTVYQMPDTNDTDETRGKWVESGKLLVSKTTTERAAKTADKTRAVYERGS